MFTNLYIVLQTQIPIEAVQTIVENQNPEGKSSVVIWIFAILLLNCLLNIGTFIMQRKLKDREVEIDRKCLTNKISVEVESHIYKEINKLSSYQRDEEHQLLDAILELQTYIETNHLYIRKKLTSICEEIVDYYTSICADFKKKNPSKEMKLREKYKKAFNE